MDTRRNIPDHYTDDEINALVDDGTLPLVIQDRGVESLLHSCVTPDRSAWQHMLRTLPKPVTYPTRPPRGADKKPRKRRTDG